MNDKYIVLDKAASMPQSCWGRYRRVAVVELTTEAAEENVVPHAIDERLRVIERVVETWEKLNVGSTERCAFARALAAAEEHADELNEADRVGQEVGHAVGLVRDDAPSREQVDAICTALSVTEAAAFRRAFARGLAEGRLRREAVAVESRLRPRVGPGSGIDATYWLCRRCA